MEKEKEFLDKLFALLKEYKADIHFTCGGDTYGIYGERMMIDINNKTIHENEGYFLKSESNE